MPTRTSRTRTVEIVPAVLRRTYEGIVEDWQKVYRFVDHVQIDVTDGVFAGDGTYRDVRRFKQLPQSEKIELHMMVQTPSDYLDDVADLAPARCIFHLESFSGHDDVRTVYIMLRQKSPQTELALAINPTTPSDRLEEHLPLLDYVLFMGYNPGRAGQQIDPTVYRKIATFRTQHPEVRVAVDGHVARDTVQEYVRAGATILCANTSIFGDGQVEENIRTLSRLVRAV